MSRPLPRAELNAAGELVTRLCCADYQGDLAERIRAVQCLHRLRAALGGGPPVKLWRASWRHDEARFYRVRDAAGAVREVAVVRLGDSWTAQPGRGPASHRATARDALAVHVPGAQRVELVPPAVALLLPAGREAPR